MNRKCAAVGRVAILVAIATFSALPSLSAALRLLVKNGDVSSLSHGAESSPSSAAPPDVGSALPDDLASQQDARSAASSPAAEERKPEEPNVAKSLEPSAAIGSLPPLAMSKLGAPASIVPLDLLPSNVNVVTHEANYGEQNPKLRPRCVKIVEEVERSTVKNRNSPAFGAFETIIGILGKNVAGENEEEQRDDDKIVNYGIEVIKSSSVGPHSLDWNYIASLRNCAVDEFGRTIFMKLVEEGHLKSLGNPGSRRLNGVDIVKLRDTMNNNILHLAVVSKNIHVAEIVLDLIGVDYSLPILSQTNINGERPVDLAIKLNLEDITTMLKGRYSTSVIMNKLSMRRRHQAPDVIRASDAASAVSIAPGH